MNETEARETLLVRAFETPLAAPWTEADRDWATHEALLDAGSQAAPDALIATRAAFAVRRLAAREPAVGAALAATAPRAGLAALLLGAAFGAGIALDSLGGRGRIEILSPPLLALLAWNVAVYLWLITSAVRHAAARGPRDAGAPHGTGVAGAGAARTGSTGAGVALSGGASTGAVRAGMATRGLWLDALLPHRLRGGVSKLPAIARFAADWSEHGAPLRAARAAALLHAGAALLAAGALASLYLRGLVFEFRAGWDSTFLDANAVHALAALLYGPASAASGIAIPGADEIARLRFAHGDGENAARWIHLQALTLAGAVIVPRAVLAVLAGARARRIARALPLPLADAYYRALLPRPAHGVAVCVLPYSYGFPETRHAALQRAIEAQTGDRIALAVAASVAPGAEDDPATLLPPQAADADAIVALFALAATPERETHAAFVRALAARVAGRAAPRVLVDETDFIARFGADGQARRAQRREAWRRLLASEGVEPVFVDLAPAAGSNA